MTETDIAYGIIVIIAIVVAYTLGIAEGRHMICRELRERGYLGRRDTP